MKTALAIAFALLAPASARADCGCGGELLAATVIEGTPELVYEANCSSAKPPAMAVVDNGMRIDVDVIATHVGHGGSVQYVLAPADTLTPGGYALVVSTYAGGTVRHPFTVVAAKRPAATLAWDGEPQVVSQRQIEYGCGPGKSVAVRVGATHAALAFVELADTTAKTHASGFVPVRDEAISIGHGMCGGPFALTKGHAYSATIKLQFTATATVSATKLLVFTYAPK